MNKFKKIGMTALAASLVSVSSHAGELTASGSASITAEGYSGPLMAAGTAFSMADSVVLSGSGELDNGLTVSMSFELEGGSDANNSFDDMSTTISSDALGTLKFSAHGGSSAVSAIDATAAGDLSDNFDGKVDGAETAIAAGDSVMLTASGGDNSFLYTLPEMVEGLTVHASYNPQGANAESSTAMSLVYAGIDGLSVSYGVGSNDGSAGTAFNADVTTMKASYAYGPVTVAYSDHSYDSATATRDQDTTSYSVAYTVTDGISVSYGVETVDSGETAIDAEYSQVSVAYTSGGMTITAKTQEAENISYAATASEDLEYWGLTLAFAF